MQVSRTCTRGLKKVPAKASQSKRGLCIMYRARWINSKIGRETFPNVIYERKQ